MSMTKRMLEAEEEKEWQKAKHDLSNKDYSDLTWEEMLEVIADKKDYWNKNV
tara:strand:+ start:62 stop:217 length:156 start_codon:yes stop_codon:yes gene_type:complete